MMDASSALISIEVDRDLRRFARRLDPELGEDAYHDAVCQVLARRTQIVNHRAFYVCAIRRALYKIFRHEQSEREHVSGWLMGDPPPTAQGLTMGRLKHTGCRRGHPLTEDNLAYIGPRRTCRTCKNAREALAGRARRAALRNTMS